MKSLDQLTAADARLAGGKAWNCARLKQAGFPVPDGLVVPADATRADIEGLASHPWLAALPAGSLLAVRSSGIDEDASGHSFAGIHETRLDVRPADVLEAVAAIRESARSPQAIAYRKAMGLAESRLDSAVLIQLMVRPLVAGVAFTVNPVSGATDEIVVNSAPGLAEALVSGLIDPDEFRIAKRDGRARFARGATLNAAQLEDLTALLLEIERHYGSPQDIEWCHDGSRFWIVQSRPITSKAAAAAGAVEWTRANLAEVLPDVTSPQALASFEHILNQAQRHHMRGLMAPEHVLGPMCKSFYGRLYFNLSQLKHVCGISGMPPASMMKSLGHPGEITEEDHRPLAVPLSQRLRGVPHLLRLIWRHVRAKRLLRAHDLRIADLNRRLLQADPDTLSDERMWALISEWSHGAPETIQIVLLFGGVVIYEDQLQAICRRVGVEFEPFLFAQLAAGERSVSAQQAFDLEAVAALARRDSNAAAQLRRDPIDLAQLRGALRGSPFLSAFDAFLERYGHRGLYETDWALPRYAEDPTPLLHALRLHIAAAEAPPPRGVDRRERTADEAWTDFERALNAFERYTLLPIARRLTRRIKQYYLWREYCRFEMIRTLAVLRRWHLVLARRFVERGWLETEREYFLLLLDEVGEIIAQGPAALNVPAIVVRRTAELDRYRRIRMPLLMRESELPALIRTAGISVADGQGELRGITTSPGLVEGEVAVIHDPGDFERMKRGAILVTRATDPSWTPLFTLASGVIVEVGGVLSHASTVAREYGLPALANVRNATKLLRSGDRIVLDATGGFVQKLQ
jgi:pyruvate,water dikinase